MTAQHCEHECVCYNYHQPPPFRDPCDNKSCPNDTRCSSPTPAATPDALEELERIAEYNRQIATESEMTDWYKGYISAMNFMIGKIYALKIIRAAQQAPTMEQTEPTMEPTMEPAPDRVPVEILPAVTPTLWNDTRRESVGLPVDSHRNCTCEGCTPIPTPVPEFPCPLRRGC